MKGQQKKINFLKKLKYRFISNESIKQIEEWDAISKNNKKTALKQGFSLLDQSNLVKYKKSDTLYILGSGSSVNELTDQDWLHIKQQDSIGFNWFFVHQFIPNYYHMEIMERDFEFFKECYPLIKEKYYNIPFMANFNQFHKDWDSNALGFIDHLSVTTPERYNEVSESAFREILRYYYHSKRYQEKQLLIHPRASIIVLISFAVLLGYKKIVLTGIDLINTEYFFYDPKYSSPIANKVSSMKQKNEIKTETGIHPTADNTLFPTNLTIDKIINIFKEEVLDYHRIEIYVTSKNSLLFPNIPILEPI